MAYVIGLAAALTLLWWGMSFVTDPIVLGLGIVSILLTVIFAIRMGLRDRESSPYHRIFGFLAYTPYLIGEILKANLTVIRAILSPDLNIQPTLVKVKTSCESDLAKVIFANSITLTPGTVTLRVDDDFLLVHGLYEADAQPDSFDEMDRRAARAGDGRKAGKGKA